MLSLQVFGQVTSLQVRFSSATRMSMGSSQTQNGTAAIEADAAATSAPPAPKDERLEALRAEMAKENVQAYIIPTEDPHMVRD